jgi:shikimate dehydrogenase
MTVSLNKNTSLCISLAARPSNFGTRFHNYLYDLLDIDFVYKAFTTTDIAGAITGVRALGIRGCSVSMPFKEDVIALVDEMDASATAIQSINTIVNDDGVLRAYNTDYIAVAQLLKESAIAPSTPFLLRGSGGMAKAVAAALRDSGFENGTIVARNPERGQSLANDLGYGWRDEVRDDEAPLLINVTPIGMAGGTEENELAYSPAAIGAAEFVFDVVALPAETPLVLRAREAGKSVITGAQVIALQAAEQFERYTVVRPSAEQVAAASTHARA